MVALLSRIAAIGAFCSGAVYVTSSAFVPSMGSGGWDFLFAVFAGLGIALGIYAAVRERIGKLRREEKERARQAGPL